MKIRIFNIKNHFLGNFHLMKLIYIRNYVIFLDFFNLVISPFLIAFSIKIFTAIFICSW